MKEKPKRPYFSWISLHKGNPHRCMHRHMNAEAAKKCGTHDCAWDHVICVDGFTPPGVAVLESRKSYAEARPVERPFNVGEARAEADAALIDVQASAREIALALAVKRMSTVYIELLGQ